MRSSGRSLAGPAMGFHRVPAAWLKTTARNRALDRMRRDTVGEAKLREVAVTGPAARQDDDNDSGIDDDRLRLRSTCYATQRSRFEAQVALTLRTLAGLTTPPR